MRRSQLQFLSSRRYPRSGAGGDGQSRRVATRQLSMSIPTTSAQAPQAWWQVSALPPSRAIRRRIRPGREPTRFRPSYPG